METTRDSHPRYRPSIDGLRSVAVLAVVLYHAFPSWMPGGFIGVDVFFVISGYLISGIIFAGLRSGTFRFREFYVRRASRIFPPLIAVMAFVAIIGWRGTLPKEWSELGGHLFAGALFFSNFRLITEAGYFDTAAELKPLLHLWSLSIEEQFYLLWPIGLAVATAFGRALARRYGRPGRARGAMAIALGLVTAASFAANIYGVSRHPTWNFFLPFTRFWELGIGGILAFLEAGTRGFSLGRPRTREGAAWAGLGLLVAGLVICDRGSTFPGFYALLPTIGAALLIGAHEGTWIARRILSFPAAVAVGKISYSLYLWHWPLLVFLRMGSASAPDAAEVGVAVGASFLLATIAYRWIESPIKHSSLPMKGRVAIGATLALALVAGIGYAAKRGWLPARSALVPSLSYAFDIRDAQEDWAFPAPEHVDVGSRPDVNLFRFGSGKVRWIVIGDSNVEQYAPRIDRQASRFPERGVLYVTRGGCPPIPGVEHGGVPKCSGTIDEIRRQVADGSRDRVIVAGQWAGYFRKESEYYFEGAGGSRHRLSGEDGRRLALDALANFVRELGQGKRQVFFLLNIPVGAEFAPDSRFSRNLFLGTFYLDPRNDDGGRFTTQTAELRRSLSTAMEAAGARVIDPIGFLCSQGVCPKFSRDGRPMYKDGGHLRATYVREKVEYLDTAFDPDER